MLLVLNETEGDLLAVRVSGKLTERDFDHYRVLVREKMERYGGVRLYFEMLSFTGWKPGSFLENALFDLVHSRKFRKVAMVGEKDWQRWAAGFADLVKAGKVRYFPVSEREFAMAWILSSSEQSF
ncbi:MAG TPA: STAS/SEC14 domain-containing protein [Sphingobacteriaceae bacterium]